MSMREYVHERDWPAVRVIWGETRWLGDDAAEVAAAEQFVQACRGWIAEIDGQAECLVLVSDATLRHQATDLPHAAVTGVTTSWVGRRQGLAGRLLALALAREAGGGLPLATLGVFDQGFYNRLGFANGHYHHDLAFDPADLLVPRLRRAPRRLGLDDAAEIHRAMMTRRLTHGSCCVLPPELLAGELRWGKKCAGLGFSDSPDGRLTHLIWFDDSGEEHGPLEVRLLCYQTNEQLLELLSLLCALSDQYRLVKLAEPPEVQLQDLLSHPLRERSTSAGKWQQAGTMGCYWQLRLLDLPAALAATSFDGHPVRFNLRLTDPIEGLLPEASPWRGVGGDYRVTLGPQSEAEHGLADGWPTLTASVGAVSQLWFGVRPASGLAVTSALAGPAELLAALDQLIRLPRGQSGWPY